MLAIFRRRIPFFLLFTLLCTACAAQNIRPYTQVFSANLKGGTAIFGNTSMHIVNGIDPDLVKMNESGNPLNTAGGLGFSNYGNDGENMQPAMVDDAVFPLNVFSAASTWKYNNPNTDQGTAWRNLAAPPSVNWLTRTGIFGYGLGQTVTIPAGNITNYFLKTVNIATPGLYSSFDFWLSYNDGAVVYVNGVEVKRLNMPAGTIGHNTTAVSAATVFNDVFSIPSSYFISGQNVIAVEIHQSEAASTNCLFDLSVSATPFVPSNATSSDLILPSGTNTIKFARLYWGGRINNSTVAAGTDTLRKIKIRKGAAGAYTDLIAPPANTDQVAITANEVLYQSYVDIKDFMQDNGAGTYSIADIPLTGGAINGGGHYGGWCIMIAYENPARPYNSIRIYDGFTQVFNAGIPVTQTVTLTGLNVPNNPLLLEDAVMSTMVWEGDANLGATLTNPLGDYVKVNNTLVGNAVNPLVNFWNGTISKNGAFVTTKNPNYSNQMGIDIDELQVGTGHGILPNATSVNFEFGTEADQYFPSIFGFSIKMKDPLITIINSVADANGNGTLQSGEVLTYTLSGLNIGPGAAYNTYIVDSIPTNATYVANSLLINNVTQTDAIDTDLAFKGNNGSRNFVKFFLGTGATASTGGTIDALGTYNVSFKVKAGIIPGSISNTARIYANAQSGDLFTDDATALIAPLASGPVDVKLTVFNAMLINNNTGLLKWETENELNNDRFEIERSDDGIHFIKLGQVAGSGNTSTVHRYTYSDLINSRSAVVYYRLKTINLDGNFLYTKIIGLRLRGSADDFAVYPNPFEDNIKVSVNTPADANAQFRIISFDGKEMLNRKINLQKGNNIVILKDLQAFPGGSYILEINTGTDKLVKKIIRK